MQFSDDNLYGQSSIERGAFSRILEKAERERDEAHAENERLRDERHRLEIKLDAAIHSIEGRELPWLRQRNEQLTRALDQACANLAVHHGTREEGRTIGDDAELWKACLLAGWGGWQGYREEFGDVRMQSDEDDAALAAAQEPPAGQYGFQATDPLPPPNGPMFDKEDIDELGPSLCLKVWERIKGVARRG